MFGQVADRLDAEYLDDDVVGGKVFEEEVLVLALPVYSVDLVLVEETLVEVLDDVLDHGDLQIYLLTDELDDVPESRPLLTLVLLPEVVVLAVVETDLQDLEPQLLTALLHEFVVPQDQLLEVVVDLVEVFELVETDGFETENEVIRPALFLPGVEFSHVGFQVEPIHDHPIELSLNFILQIVDLLLPDHLQQPYLLLTVEGSDFSLLLPLLVLDPADLLHNLHVLLPVEYPLSLLPGKLR